MSIWLVRAGKHGEQEQGALDNNVVTIGWSEFQDLNGIHSRDELMDLYYKLHPNAKKMQVVNEAGQIWRFIHEVQKGDLVALPLKTQAAIAIGEVRGDYEYKQITENIKHIRQVKWLKIIPRAAFDQDILYSLGAFMTVCQISRNDAENRIKALLKKEEFPIGGEKEIEVEEEAIDIEQYARDQIIKYIGRKFVGHDLARLVEAILNAQGYITETSAPGPDGGIDILAASGTLGFDHPRICAQVKSSPSQVDVKVLRELQGVMSKVRAEQGLLISWGGFTNKALQEARDAFFTIRMWDSGNLLNSIFKYYEQFNDELKAELPLKRIWGLVLEEE